MDARRIARNCLAIGGIVEIVIAIIHFIWPWFLVDYGEFAGLSADYRNLLLLSSLAIGVCLSVFGFLSVYFSARIPGHEGPARVFGISQGLLWGARAALEVLYPVRLPLFFVATPTVIVLPMTVVLGLVYLVPSLLLTGRSSRGKGSKAGR
jgi:hypothetical protein